MNDFLRREVKLLKALQGISYTELAESYLEIKKNSFYSWLHGDFDLSLEKQKLLYEVIETLKEWMLWILIDMYIYQSMDMIEDI